MPRERRGGDRQEAGLFAGQRHRAAVATRRGPGRGRRRAQVAWSWTGGWPAAITGASVRASVTATGRWIRGHPRGVRGPSDATPDLAADRQSTAQAWASPSTHRRGRPPRAAVGCGASMARGCSNAAVARAPPPGEPAAWIHLRASQKGQPCPVGSVVDRDFIRRARQVQDGGRHAPVGVLAARPHRVARAARAGYRAPGRRSCPPASWLACSCADGIVGLDPGDATNFVIFRL
jgi:hypothetical protein